MSASTDASVDPYDDDTTDGVEMRHGRQATQGTWTPDWVTLAPGMPGQSIKLYQLMRMRLNSRRRDSKVWPSTASLAVMMGFETTEPITKWLKPLIAIEAVDVHGEGMPRRNVYILHETPPPGYQDHVRLEEWDRDPANKIAIAAIKKAARAKRAKHGKVKPQVSPVPADRPEQARPAETPAPVPADRPVHVTADRPVHVTADRPVHVTADRPVPSSREPLEREPPPPSPRHDGAAPPRDEPKPEEEDGSPPGGTPTDPGPDLTTTAADILGAVQHGGNAYRGKRLLGRELREMTDAVAAKLRQGWPRNVLEDALDGPLDDVTNSSVLGVLRARLKRLEGAEPPTPRPPAPAPREPERCVRADCANGYVTVPVRQPVTTGTVVDGKVYPADPRSVTDKLVGCPTCRPELLANQLARSRAATFDDLVTMLTGP